MKRTDLLEKVEVLRQFGSKRRRGGKKRERSECLSPPFLCMSEGPFTASLPRERGRRGADERPQVTRGRIISCLGMIPCPFSFYFFLLKWKFALNNINVFISLPDTCVCFVLVFFFLPPLTFSLDGHNRICSPEKRGKRTDRS